MSIDVIIPVINRELATDLLKNIESNTLLPKEVIIIDNTPEDELFRFDTDKFLISYYYSKTGMLNESWELARSKLSQYCDYVCFLNDDIIIGDWFFQRMFRTFKSNLSCGVACPEICFDKNEVVKGKAVYNTMKKRVGCAFTIKRILLDKIPRIPHEVLTTFSGDDWIWYHTHKYGYNWIQDIGNVVFHYVGVSIIKFGFRSLKKVEKNVWIAIEARLKVMDK